MTKYPNFRSLIADSRPSRSDAGAADIGVPFGHRTDDNRVRDRVRRVTISLSSPPNGVRMRKPACTSMRIWWRVWLMPAAENALTNSAAICVKPRHADLHPRPHSGEHNWARIPCRAAPRVLRFLQILQPFKQTVDDTAPSPGRLAITSVRKRRDAVVAVPLKHHQVGKFVRMGVKHLILHQGC